MGDRCRDCGATKASGYHERGCPRREEASVGDRFYEMAREARNGACNEQLPHVGNGISAMSCVRCVAALLRRVAEEERAAGRREGFDVAQSHAWVFNGDGSSHIEWGEAEDALTALATGDTGGGRG